jgi:hypothetical protein
LTDSTISLLTTINSALWTETNPAKASVRFLTSLPDRDMGAYTLAVQEVPHRLKVLGAKHLMQPAEATTASHVVHIFVRFNRVSQTSMGTAKVIRYNMVEMVKSILLNNPDYKLSADGVYFFLCGQRVTDEVQFEPPVLHTVIEVAVVKIG